MTKYTINKAFEKEFPLPIWKIEVDCLSSYLAIEFRHPDTTIPHFSVIDFAGNILLNDFEATEKEWTLEAIQGDYLICKKYGSSTPIQEGICIIHIPSQQIVATFHEYILKEVFNHTILALHRSIPNGLSFYIDIKSGKVSNTAPDTLQLPLNTIQYPIAYQGNIPPFIKELSFVDQIWLQPFEDIFIWSYHTSSESTLNLNLCLSTKNEIIDTKVILSNISKLIPQPYFQVKEHIFFLSSNKQKIATYLV